MIIVSLSVNLSYFAVVKSAVLNESAFQSGCPSSKSAQIPDIIAVAPDVPLPMR